MTASVGSVVMGASSAGPITPIPMFDELRAKEVSEVALAAHGASSVNSRVDTAEPNQDISGNMQTGAIVIFSCCSPSRAEINAGSYTTFTVPSTWASVGGLL